MASADPGTGDLVARGRPYDVRPERLYTRDDLMRGWQPGDDHSTTLDGRIYATSRRTAGVLPTSTKASRNAPTTTSSTSRWRAS